MRVEYHPAVEAEFREIKRRYEDCSPGLGIQFLDEFERQVLALGILPLDSRPDRVHSSARFDH